jgi:hypothetical protein
MVQISAKNSRFHLTYGKNEKSREEELLYAFADATKRLRCDTQVACNIF